MAEWFEEWFNDEYLELYPHRDDAEADRLVSLLQDVTPWREGWRVLDVGCGPGRHARARDVSVSISPPHCSAAPARPPKPASSAPTCAAFPCVRARWTSP